jgi:hypothetical protein
MATEEEYKRLKKQGLPDAKIFGQLGFVSAYALDRWKRTNKVKVGHANQYTVGGIKRGKESKKRS